MPTQEAIVDAAIMALRKHMAAQATTHLTLFIDPWIADPVGALPAAQALKRTVLPLRVDGYPVDKQPYLLHVPDETAYERIVSASMQEGVMEALADTAEEEGTGARSVCAWIVGEVHKPKQLAETLSRLAKILRPDHTWHPLRFWDPRVVPHLPRVLESERYTALRHAMGNWYFLDTAAQLATLPIAFMPGLEGDAPPWFFSEAQWQRLATIKPINQALKQSQKWGLHAGALTDTTRLAPRFETAIQTAQALGYGAEQDLLVFCACTQTAHEHFYTHPEIVQALASGTQRGASLIEVISPFDDAFWAEVRAGLWLEPTQNSKAKY